MDNNEITGLKYPLLMVHGMGFRDSKFLNYWGRIPGELEKLSCKIFYGNQDSNADIETNGEVIKRRIDEILAETGAEKVNILAHSKGGLDCRYAISTLGAADKVASLTTISTPHNGSKSVDLLLKLPDFLVRFVGKCTDLVFKICGDKKPNSYRVFHSFSTKCASEFNHNNPDVEDLYYQSYAFVMKSPFSDIFMFFPCLAVNLIEGKNDGLLTPDAVKWGDFRGIYKSNSRRGISHCDEVDMRRRRLTKRQGDGISDMPEFYCNIVKELKEKGF